MGVKKLLKILIIQTMLLLFGVLFVYGQKAKYVDYAADYVEGIKLNGDDVRKLMGNVVFRDSGTTMYCDSAYSYKNQDFDAYGNVRIYPNRSNTQLTGKILHYNAEERIANITHDVILNDDKTILKTETAYYDLKTGIAHYPTKGVITKDDNTIVSNTGSYNTHNNTFYLKHKVVVTNPTYIITTDTMNYLTKTKIAEFKGPTIIVSKDDSIYCEDGWYNTTNDISDFRKNAWLKGDGKVLKGDTLYYEQKTGFGRGYGNVELWDTTQNVLIRGNFATIDRATQKAVVTKNALMIWVDKTDSLYLHADTIRSGTFTENRDSVTIDTFKYVKAYHHVKFFKTNFQGRCDSMYYSLKDSTLELHGSPILWSDKNQLTANFAKLFTKNQKMDRLAMDGLAFIVSREDSSHYNQIKGKNMLGYFKNNEMTHLVVKGNGQSVYFPIDKGIVQGVNKSESSSITLYFKNRQMNTITYVNTVSGKLVPLDKIEATELQLKDFQWHIEKRPLQWQDVFVW